MEPSRALSQNFLKDSNIVRKLCDAANVSPGDPILEIGGGMGAITEELARRGARLYVVEKDRRAQKYLEKFPIEELYIGDIRSYDFDSLPESTKVVANLPFHLSSPILDLLIHPHINSAYLIVQEEFMRRMVAEPGSSDYSSLTVFLNFYGACRRLFSISRSCYTPIPKVDTAAVEVIYREPLLKESGEFFKMVKKAFQQRRKMLRASLREYGDVERALSSIGESPTARPTLSCAAFIKLFHVLDHSLS